MAMTSLSSQTLDAHILALMDKLDHVQGELSGPPLRLPMHLEVRRLEFWRAVIAECLATLLLVFLICAAHVPWSTHASWTPQSEYAAAFTAGFGAAALTQCFWRVSGAHMNPAVSLALASTRRISPLRCLLYMAAQCGGSIAGAALLYGSSAASLQGSLGVTVVTPPLTAWQGFGVEFVLTFVLVFVYCSVTEPTRRPLSGSSLIIGLTYLTVSLAGIRCTGASINPARSLGPAFVMNIWKDHWVYWFSPLTAAVIAAFIHEYIFNPSRRQRINNSMDTESIAANSEDEAFEDERPKLSAAGDYSTLRAQNLALYGAGGGERKLQTAGARSVFSVPAYRVHRTESVYGGTKSLYHYSPRPTRTSNLARSQSVYAKEPRGGGEPAEGGMKPAQSLYPRIASGGGGLLQSDSVYGRAVQRPQPLYPGRREPPEQRQPLYTSRDEAAARTRDYVTSVTYTASPRPDDYLYGKPVDYGKAPDYSKAADYGKAGDYGKTSSDYGKTADYGKSVEHGKAANYGKDFGKSADYGKCSDYGRASDYAKRMDYAKHPEYVNQTDYGRHTDFVKVPDYGRQPDYDKQTDFSKTDHEKQADYGKHPELFAKPTYPGYQPTSGTAERDNAHNQRSAASRLYPGHPGYGRTGAPPPPPPPPPRNGGMVSPRSTLSDAPSALTTPNSIASSYR